MSSHEPGYDDNLESWTKEIDRKGTKGSTRKRLLMNFITSKVKRLRGFAKDDQKKKIVGKGRYHLNAQFANNLYQKTM